MSRYFLMYLFFNAYLKSTCNLEFSVGSTRGVKSKLSQPLFIQYTLRFNPTSMIPIPIYDPWRLRLRTPMTSQYFFR